MSYDYDLGTHSRAVTTTAPEAQTWFDRGLVWTYAYHHHEAIACFQKALEADPGCAMAQWGIGYAAGPQLQHALVSLRSRGQAPRARDGL